MRKNEQFLFNPFFERPPTVVFASFVCETVLIDGSFCLLADISMEIRSVAQNQNVCLKIYPQRKILFKSVIKYFLFKVDLNIIALLGKFESNLYV